MGLRLWKLVLEIEKEDMVIRALEIREALEILIPLEASGIVEGEDVGSGMVDGSHGLTGLVDLRFLSLGWRGVRGEGLGILGSACKGFLVCILDTGLVM